jgi:hypothetical protein
MSRLALILIAAATLLAADNPWVKVKELPNRSELRIYRKSARQPLTATLADTTDEQIVVVVKNQQLTIAKDDIDRIDARPLEGSKKPVVTTTEKTTDPDYTPKPNASPAVPGTSSSSSVSFGGKPDFKTVYTRPLAALTK